VDFLLAPRASQIESAAHRSIFLVLFSAPMVFRLALKLPLASCFWFAIQICALVFTSAPDLVLFVEFVSGKIWFPVSSSFFRLTLALISGNGPAV
jgi:hypothetical protein